MEKVVYPVTGMSCAACAGSVQTILEAQEGVKEASASYASHEAVIEFDPQTITNDQLKEALKAVGYDLIIEEESAAEQVIDDNFRKKIKSIRRNFILSAFFSVPLILISMVFTDIPYANWIMMGLSTPVLLFFGRQFFVNAWKLVKHGMANMDTLVALSTGTAYVFSLLTTSFPEYFISKGLEPHVYYEAATVIITFILLGKWLEEKAKGNTASAIKKLLGLQPKFTTRIEGDAEREVPISFLENGDLIKVKPGEQIPVDGEVLSGST
jgi:Cu2+-exporting ATPase